MEHGIEPVLKLALVVLKRNEGGLLQKHDGNEVEPRHRTDTHVRHGPDERGRIDGAKGNRADEDRLAGRHEHGLPDVAVEIGHVRLGHIVVTKNRREGKKENRDADEGTAPAGHQLINGRLRIHRPGFDTLETFKDHGAVRSLHVVAARHQDHEASGRTDEKCVDVDREGLHKPLLGRVRNSCCRRSVRARTLTCLVGIDAALDAPGNRSTQHAARQGVKTEGTVDNQRHHGRNLLPVDTDDDERYDDVGLSHEGHDPGRKGGDATQTTDNHKAGDGGNDGSRHFSIKTEGLVPGKRDRIALHAGAEEARSKNRNDRERPGIGLELQASFNVKGGTAAILALNALLVDLTERRLHKGR